jgi:hypothetical protein
MDARDSENKVMVVSTPLTPSTMRRPTASAATLWLLVGAVVLMLLLQLVVGGLMPPIGLIQAAVLGVPLALVATRTRGGFVTTVVLVVLLLLASAGPIVEDLATPQRVPSFVWTVIALPELIATGAAAVVAAVDQRRRRRTAVDS